MIFLYVSDEIFIIFWDSPPGLFKHVSHCFEFEDIVGCRNIFFRSSRHLPYSRGTGVDP